MVLSFALGSKTMNSTESRSWSEVLEGGGNDGAIGRRDRLHAGLVLGRAAGFLYGREDT
jgi:hypothetical protein